MAMLGVHRLAVLLASAALFCPAMSGAAPQADTSGPLAAPSFQVVISGRYFTVWKKLSDGTWKVALDASADEPPATGECCVLPKP